ncbi:hypothetical protein ACSBR2_035531 [Camellia fascicularis]
MFSRKMMSDAAADSSALVAVAVANAFALSVVVYATANIFGRHVNSAVTFGMTLVGSVMACLFLNVTTVSQHVPVPGIPQEMTGFEASILERVMTFGLVYTVYVAGDPRHGPLGVIGPLAIVFIVEANVLAFGPFTGGSIYLAYSFGSALVGDSFENHLVYWVRPLKGATLAGILYDNVVFPVEVPDIADGVGV